jgi:hypothetical protein
VTQNKYLGETLSFFEFDPGSGVKIEIIPKSLFIVDFSECLGI